VFELDESRAKRALARLVEAGVLVSQGERRGRRYLRGAGWDAWVVAAQSADN